MTRNLACAIAGGALLILAGSASAVNAEDRGFCRDYARAALRQVRGALSHERCIRRMDDQNRWSTDFGVHYRWCRGVSADQADAERNARRETLERCPR